MAACYHPPMPPRVGVGGPGAPLVLVLAGCFSDPGLTGSASDATGTASTTASTTSAAATSAPTATDSAASTAAATTHEATIGTSTTGGLTTGGPTTGDATTGATDPSTTDPATTGPTTTGTSTTDGPTDELLLHVDPAACTKPLWCHEINDVFKGTPARVVSAECFTSALPAPIAVTELRYWVAATLGQVGLGSNLVRVHAYANGLPGAILHEDQLGPLDVSVGAHTLPLDPPLIIEGSSFCVSLIGGAPVTNTSLGVAVVDGDPAPGASFIRIDGQIAACKIAEWLDLTAADPPVTPNGPWCIGAHVTAP